MGKITEINREARMKIAEECEMRGLDRCELRFNGCMGNMFCAPAHKERREWYLGQPELLSDYNHFLVACSHCHEILDNRSKTTKEESDMFFVRLRG